MARYMGRTSSPWGEVYMMWRLPDGRKFVVPLIYYRMMTIGRMI